MHRLLLVLLALFMVTAAPLALTASCQSYEATTIVVETCHTQTVYEWTREMSHSAVNFLADSIQPFHNFLYLATALFILISPFPKQVYLKPALPPPRSV